ncbi:hypothetical protein PsorP6_011093 [Peronosclerospora sorghi]|uniref:Uncharacterized protein n=1 Tax=Peronosclerospora sorghi TaxID=230839 RepID=A0ACC0VWV1_9STRA|nr:hypothetical protein PsorP6_011093 [Peronosclerospora sorghi]
MGLLRLMSTPSLSSVKNQSEIHRQKRDCQENLAADMRFYTINPRVYHIVLFLCNIRQSKFAAARPNSKVAPYKNHSYYPFLTLY